MEKPKSRGKHRIQAENEIIRRREKETRYNEFWNGTVKYFDHCSQNNTKFEEWTSPRYYNENNKLLLDIKNKKDKEELLEKRREKLRKLYQEETKSFDIELMVYKNRYLVEKPRRVVPDVYTNILKDINDSLKLEHDAKRRREAEAKLFNQWRRNNPIVRQYEAKYNCKDLKLSWLDQQIEKQMQKEREEEEAKRILKENEKKLKIELEKEEQLKKQMEQNKQKFTEALDQQMFELKEKQNTCEEIKEKEHKEIEQKIRLSNLEETLKLEEQRRRDKEYALFNIKQHNRKLRQKSLDIQENLQQEKLLINKLKELQLEEIIQEETRRNEIREEINEFQDIIKQQQALEVQRQKRLEFLFDSEAKAMFDMQTELWRQEEKARQKLISDVLTTVKDQINSRIEQYKETQKQNIREREEMTQKIEEYHQQLTKLKEDEVKRKRKNKQAREEEMQVKMIKKKQQESLKMKELDVELERIRKEEERLQQEILRLQQKQRPYRPSRNTLF